MYAFEAVLAFCFQFIEFPSEWGAVVVQLRLEERKKGFPIY